METTYITFQRGPQVWFSFGFIFFAHGNEAKIYVPWRYRWSRSDTGTNLAPRPECFQVWNDIYWTSLLYHLVPLLSIFLYCCIVESIYQSTRSVLLEYRRRRYNSRDIHFDGNNVAFRPIIHIFVFHQLLLLSSALLCYSIAIANNCIMDIGSVHRRGAFGNHKNNDYASIFSWNCCQTNNRVFSIICNPRRHQQRNEQSFHNQNEANPRRHHMETPSTRKHLQTRPSQIKIRCQCPTTLQ